MGESKSEPTNKKTSTKPVTTTISQPTNLPHSQNPPTDLSSQPTANIPNDKTSNSQKEPKTQKPHKPKTILKVIIFLIIIFAFFGTIIALWILGWLSSQPTNTPNIDRVDFPDPIYSNLTGEEITDAKLNDSPTFCVQIPNGLDGARPQAGLNQAAVVFEAIAEAGITRFAAIFQNPTTSAIGPIRSLRPYYLEWDTPFDCTVTHAGGSNEANTALWQGNYRDLNESPVYMWRETSNRGWNNLFTSSNDLASFNQNQDYTSSTPKTFPHLTPDEVQAVLAQNFSQNNCSNEDNNCLSTIISNISINFGISPLFNTYYTYDTKTNKYTRYFATGNQHLTYSCSSELYHPNTVTSCGNPEPVAPNVIIAMVVSESLMADNYHENIRTIGSGTATIFQNGKVIEGSWTKTSAEEQIVFRDASGNIIKLTPGQTWISAIPQYGSVSYETIVLE